MPPPPGIRRTAWQGAAATPLRSTNGTKQCTVILLEVPKTSVSIRFVCILNKKLLISCRSIIKVASSHRGNMFFHPIGYVRQSILSVVLHNIMTCRFSVQVCGRWQIGWGIKGGAHGDVLSVCRGSIRRTLTCKRARGSFDRRLWRTVRLSSFLQSIVSCSLFCGRAPISPCAHQVQTDRCSTLIFSRTTSQTRLRGDI